MFASKKPLNKLLFKPINFNGFCICPSGYLLQLSKVGVVYSLTVHRFSENQTRKMMETVGRSRRSQRAASLTAQVLLNYQIEDENNNNIIMT